MLNISQLHQLFEAHLEKNKILKKPQSLYDPANYIMRAGGKRIRPLLALLAYQLFDTDVKQALPAALSVEMFHNFSLVHDDIMDEASLRRGNMTVHKKYGTNNAILSGDVMLIYAYQYLLQTSRKPVINEMVNVLSKVAIKVCEGQQYDVDFETKNHISLEDYLHMIELKTAALLAGSLELGALAAGSNDENRHHLAEFGRLTGIAFQIQDDYLDTFGNPLKFGKHIGGDIAQNKKTALFIKALELADDTTRQQLLSLYNSLNDTPDKIKSVTTIFKQLGIPSFLEKLQDQYQDEAYLHLEAINAPFPEGKILIKNLTESLLQRQN